MRNFLAVLVIFGITMNNIDEAKSVPAPQSIPPLIEFKDGKIGVNFLGFHAAAGLNGAGLHAEAGTPYGQKASAGLGGSLGNDGAAAGRLYAGATAGGNIRAAAGLGGGISGGENSRAAGGLFSAASAGGLQAGKTLTGGVADGQSYGVAERVETKPRKVLIVEDDDGDESSNSKALSDHHENVGTRVATDEDDNRTNRHKVIVKNRSRVRGHPIRFNKFFKYQTQRPRPEANKSPSGRQTDQNNDNGDVDKETINGPVVITNRRTVQKPITAAKYYTYEAAPAAEKTSGPGPQGFLDAFFGPSNNFHNAAPQTAHTHVEAQKSNQRPGTFFDDIFNIPISTLNAVSKFLSNSVPSHGSAVNVKKTVTVS